MNVDSWLLIKNHLLIAGTIHATLEVGLWDKYANCVNSSGGVESKIYLGGDLYVSRIVSNDGFTGSIQHGDSTINWDNVKSAFEIGKSIYSAL